MIPIVIPVRFGKSRLAGALSPAVRADLTLAMMADVVAASVRAGLEPFVLSPDARVLEEARSLGATTIAEGESGLNRSLAHALGRLSADSATALVILGDVAAATANDLASVAAVLSPGRLVLVPSADGGTNLLGVPLPLGFELRFGPDSFRRHIEAGDEAGLEVAVLEPSSLGVDLDSLESLQAFLESGPQGRTRELLRRALAAAPAS